MWYDFWEFLVIMVRCSSTDLVTCCVLCMLDEDVEAAEAEAICWKWRCCLKVDCLGVKPPSLSFPELAALNLSRLSLKLGPLSIVCCCCS